MNFLNWFIIIPVLTIIAINIAKDYKKVRVIAGIGMGIQLLLSVYLVVTYIAMRKAGDVAEMLFYSDKVWYESLNIHYVIGVDGISSALILLTGIISFAGGYASWEIKDQAK